MTSGWASAMWRATWSMRRRTELMFQLVTESFMPRLSASSAASDSAGRKRGPELGPWRGALQGMARHTFHPDRLGLPRHDVDVLQGHGGLVALRVDDDPLPEDVGLRVEDERHLRRAAERRAVLEDHLDDAGRRGAHVEHLDVAGEVHPVLHQELQR